MARGAPWCRRLTRGIIESECRDLTPDHLSVTAVVTLDSVDGKPTIVSSALTVNAVVPGVDASGFQSIVDEVSAGCPVSRLFAGAEITVDASLVKD